MFRKRTDIKQEEVPAKTHQMTEEKAQHDKIFEDKEKCIVSTMGVVNELLQYMTGLDYVREMIIDASDQADMIQNVAASSEEMTAATEDISNYVQISSDNMRKAKGETDQALDKVEKTFSSVEENMNQIDGVKDIMAEVKDETVKINELVSVIKSVADQTNLLSLNASIEAARAGKTEEGLLWWQMKSRSLPKTPKNRWISSERLLKVLMTRSIVPLEKSTRW
nr:methyl-accepting chemotaxis protein [Proteiniclasticum sp.]